MEKATRDSWNNLKPMSEKKARISLDRKFSEDEFNQISFGLIPQAMEDKWFIFLEDNSLYFHRSWTGECIYQATFCKENDQYFLKEVWVCRDQEKYQFTSDSYDEQLLLFLIENLLLGKDTPFPLLKTLANTIKGVFQHSVSGTGYREKIVDED
jgi:hypothetical protein